jgi:hypothetical protein
MNGVAFKTLRDGCIEDAGLLSAQDSTLNARFTSYINTALDYAYPWNLDGWRELRKATSETVTSQVIDLNAVGAGYWGVCHVLGVTKEHPWKSSNPTPREYDVAGTDIIVPDTVTDATLWVAHIEAPPVFSSTAWATGTPYVVGDVRLEGNDCYYCLTAHTSGTFATDLAASKWAILKVPGFLNIPVRQAVVQAYLRTDGQEQTSQSIQRLLDTHLNQIATRHTPAIR